MPTPPRTHRRTARLAALLLPLVLVVGACGGKKNEDGSGDAGDPVRGGSVTYGVEAETSDGWCLPESQLAISGIMVARAIYDTLTVPNDKGEYIPYLAKSVEPSDDYKAWTINLRKGVKFHDGSPLTAEVVKNNLDAYRGQYEGRKPLLFIFVLDNIDTVEVTGELEVTVKTKVPWVAFPAFLYSSGRLGMIAQAQLDDEKTCDRKLIGTGPFELKRWEKDRELVAVKNPNYWQDAPDGKPYPYLDEIRFQVITDGEQRVNSLDADKVDMAHFSAAPDFKTTNPLADSGDITFYDSNKNAEVAFLQMNTSKPPLDDTRVRKAIALALDRDDYKEVINRGLFTNANGPFAKGSIAYLDDTGFPVEHDLEQAKALLADYEGENGQVRTITYQSGPGTANKEEAVYWQQLGKDLGINIKIDTVQQDQLIDNAISGDYDIMGFRNYPGGDPDELYVWFHSGSPANFARITDPKIDQLLEDARSEPDQDKRAEMYQDMNRQFGAEVWCLWNNWTTWRIASLPGVHGYDPETAPKLPNGERYDTGLATGHPVLGLWVAQ